MRPTLVVLLPPRLHFLPGVRQIIEPVHVETFVPETSVERLDERIVRRLSRPRELHGHAVGISPQINQPADELAPVAHPNVVEYAQFPT